LEKNKKYNRWKVFSRREKMGDKYIKSKPKGGVVK
jgi:hypothetical protein